MSHTIPLARRKLLAAAASGLASTAATAERPPALPRPTEQVPGVYRARVGDAVVTALLDGYIDILPAWWVGLSPEALRRELADAFLPPDAPLRISVNAWLVQDGRRTVLIDAGADTLFGDTAGRFARNLAAAGATPADVDAVLLTHLHPDHLGGLIAGGRATFPRAGVHVAERELAYWTDPAAASAAPDFARPWFAAVATLRRAYGPRVLPFADGAEPVAGIRAMALPGHTPGHTGFMLTSGRDALFFWADTTDSTALQLNSPERTLVFDVDQALGAASRRRAIEMAARDRLLVAGSHIPFPGLGHVRAEAGRYGFVPAEWVHVI